MTPKYWRWVEREARKIKSDGCTHAFEVARRCCWEHDLAFFYGRDPRSAFRKGSWKCASPIGFMEANNRFGSCLPWWLKYRWVAVSVGGLALWHRHRAKRA